MTQQISPVEISALQQTIRRPERRPRQEDDRSDALSQIYRLLSSIEDSLRSQQRDFWEVVNADMKRYQEETNQLCDERNFQGWSVATLTCAGAMMHSLSPLVGAINSLDPSVADLVISLGGVDAVKKLCETGGTFAEGVKQPASIWTESKTSEIETNKQFLQFAYSQGQRAADQSNATVEKLVSAALRIYDTDSKSKFNS